MLQRTTLGVTWLPDPAVAHWATFAELMRDMSIRWIIITISERGMLASGTSMSRSARLCTHCVLAFVHDKQINAHPQSYLGRCYVTSGDVVIYEILFVAKRFALLISALAIVLHWHAHVSNGRQHDFSGRT